MNEIPGMSPAFGVIKSVWMKKIFSLKVIVKRSWQLCTYLFLRSIKERIFFLIKEKAICMARVFNFFRIHRMKTFYTDIGGDVCFLCSTFCYLNICTKCIILFGVFVTYIVFVLQILQKHYYVTVNCFYFLLVSHFTFTHKQI